ncbi:Agmatinase [Kluyvera cryocrescens]|uniref:Agmatinase n=1 Tax=Kluyvera cryocrescens TaxID=580 RepID=A0A485ANW9_KLUCR|nr:Agmatinase [Kluyvera cryocrescens]
MSTLGHQYDNSLVSNAFGFLRLPMNFQPYDSDADWVITGVPFDMATSRSCRRPSRPGGDSSGFH